ncbi:MAG: adenylate/guanylate cyclase domain-containing protein [Symploca sp. SIO3C6]|nr:adenylate/guanylate cyclase domain-containing protein [Symploca sp. SIO3C6]
MSSRILKIIGIARHDWASMLAVSIATIATAGLTFTLHNYGGLQPLELLAFNQLVRWRPQETEPEPRILLITISEQDIRLQRHWPFSDQVLAQLLSKLQAQQPAVIGLDLYRDLPVEPGHKQLVAQLEQPNVIAIQSINSLTGTPAPPNIPPERIGFNDIPKDPDDVIRRNLLFAENEQGTLFSFSLRLALAYLEKQGIYPQNSESRPDSLQLGSAVFLKLQPNSGGYQNIDADGYQILLNYRQLEKVARQVSLSEVLNGKIHSNWLKDKIVIIGSTAPSLKDVFATPYRLAMENERMMPGVVIHAEMVSQILDAATGKRPLFGFWSQWAEILWICSWIVSGSILGRLALHPISLVLGVALGLGVLCGTCLYLFTNAVWVPLAAPGLGFVLTVGTVITYRSHQARQQQQIVMKLLGQNTSPEIAQTLWQQSDRLLKWGKLPGTNLTATMLFTDIVGFSTISEQMNPEALLNWLNQLLDAIAQEVLFHQGIVNKFTGDGVMAVFGVPSSGLDASKIVKDAQGAVACALAISDRLEEMNQNWELLGLPTIKMRIGIFTGSIIAGSLGGKNRLEYGVIGDSVNTASRLESCLKDRQCTNCRILIGEETLVHLQGKFKVESWGALALKGKQQMVNVYRVLGS